MSDSETTDQSDDSTTFTFNWHDLEKISWSESNEESFNQFLSWFLVHLVVPTEEHERSHWYDEISKKTDQFSNVELKILINGVEGNVKHVLTSVHANMVHYARQAALEELRSSTEFRNMRRIMRSLEGAVVDRMEQVARGFGLTLESDDDE